MVKYIGVYIDYTNDELKYSERTYSDLESAKYDLNFVIGCFIHDNYDVFLSDEYMYINNPLNVKINIIQTIKLKTQELMFIKNGLVIDIYIKNTQKGYIYNKTNEKHIYKFSILKISDITDECNDMIPIFNNASSLSLLYNKTSVKHSIRNQVLTGSSIKKIISDEKPEELSEITSETPINIKNLFLEELKEKLKRKSKID